MLFDCVGKMLGQLLPKFPPQSDEDVDFLMDLIVTSKFACKYIVYNVPSRSFRATKQLSPHPEGAAPPLSIRMGGPNL